jgi:NAD(P)-dependent dehydrogenase (short-subunit alcohol dehydrogenase family)
MLTVPAWTEGRVAVVAGAASGIGLAASGRHRILRRTQQDIARCRNLARL